MKTYGERRDSVHKTLLGQNVVTDDFPFTTLHQDDNSLFGYYESEGYNIHIAVIFDIMGEALSIVWIGDDSDEWNLVEFAS